MPLINLSRGTGQLRIWKATSKSGRIIFDIEPFRLLNTDKCNPKAEVDLS